jgi:hypothetical protein
MKINQLASFVAAPIMVCGFGVSLISSPALAQSVQFSCEDIKVGSQNIPVTLYKTGTVKRQLIRWYKTMGPKNEYTPEKRCPEVTRRLTNFFSNSSQFVTHGTMNRQPVICLTSKKGGVCNHLLLTLETPAEAKATLESLFALDPLSWEVNNNAVGNTPIQQKCPTYISLKAIIAGQRKVAQKVCQ